MWSSCCASASTTRPGRPHTRIEGDPSSGLPPWREVITPLPDVAKGNFVQAQVRRQPVAGVALKEDSSEYKEPGEFFRRTYITEGLRHLLVGALKRLLPPATAAPLGRRADRLTPTDRRDSRSVAEGFETSQRRAPEARIPISPERRPQSRLLRQTVRYASGTHSTGLPCPDRSRTRR